MSRSGFGFNFVRWNANKKMSTLLSLQDLLGENLHPDLQQFDFGGTSSKQHRVVYDRFTRVFSARLLCWVAFPFLFFLVVFLVNNLGLTVVWDQVAKPLFLKIVVFLKKCCRYKTTESSQINTNTVMSAPSHLLAQLHSINRSLFPQGTSLEFSVAKCKSFAPL
jgi:hypothetical protein